MTFRKSKHRLAFSVNICPEDLKYPQILRNVTSNFRGIRKYIMPVVFGEVKM